MATYNGEKYLKEQLDSILKQIKSSDELIISDDGSTDLTCTIIKEYQKEYKNIYFNSCWYNMFNSFYIFNKENYKI